MFVLSRSVLASALRGGRFSFQACSCFSRFSQYDSAGRVVDAAVCCSTPSSSAAQSFQSSLDGTREFSRLRMLVSILLSVQLSWFSFCRMAGAQRRRLEDRVLPVTGLRDPAGRFTVGDSLRRTRWIRTTRHISTD